MKRLSLLLFSLVFATAAHAQGGKVVRMVVPFAAGGPADFVARTLASKLGEPLGSNVIIENRPGANGVIGVQAVTNAAPDGTTLLFATSGMLTISPILDKKLPYDPLKDLVPVSKAVENGTAMIVNASLPVKNLKEFIQYAHSRNLAFGSAGNGNILHLYLELFNESTKLDIMHVPYKGIAPAMTDVIGGQIAGAFADLPISLQHIRSGKVRALGMVGSKRAMAAPDIPTLAEQGVAGVDGVSWFGVLAPAKTTPEDARRLADAVAKALSDREVREKLQAAGSEPAPSSPEDMVKLIRADQARWARIINERKITME